MEDAAVRIIPSDPEVIYVPVYDPVAYMNGNAKRYRAYVCHAGVFDRVATFSADSYAERPKDLAALYWENPAKVRAQSPHTFAHRFVHRTRLRSGPAQVW